MVTALTTIGIVIGAYGIGIYKLIKDTKEATLLKGGRKYVCGLEECLCGRC